MEKEFWKSKTFWFNVLALLVTVGTSLGFKDFQPSQEVGEIALVVVTIINVVLRFMTKEQLVARAPRN